MGIRTIQKDILFDLLKARKESGTKGTLKSLDELILRMEATMEEEDVTRVEKIIREEEIMTDYQFKSILKLILMIIEKAEDLDEVHATVKGLIDEE